ncbi:hypothetical protein CLV30_104136 [Haloactinopolyspora alba]|uniref:Uncharacterized protein n=1 Tax=Haloactinopolyspora alba TaxID=648780 RepID=A0A2P8E724_9ACTN|nr:hypothetical protein [Haloactinopolyspora alba]PSL05270.1 hypothetical protein CLV30_104136 [Haloactinopolyspora alba]
MSGVPSIRLMVDDERRHRYPARMWAGDTIVELTPDVTVGRSVATVVDGSGPPATAPEADRALVSLDVLAGLPPGDGFPFAAGRWVPLLPVDVSADLETARQYVAEGAIGTPHVVDLTVPVGLPPSGEWDVDHVTAVSPLEAMVFGIRIAEFVANAVVVTSSWLSREPSVSTAVHTLDSGVQVVHHIVPAHSTPATMFDGVVLGGSGRLALRQPFAPGSVGVWSPGPPGYTFPAVREAKHDVQAPDSVVGGWELAALLSELVAPGARAVRLGEDATRLVRHAVRQFPGGNDDH